MFFLVLAALLAVLTTLTSAAPVARRANAIPKPAKTTLLGYATDAAFNPALYRDGGGGGCLTMLGTCVIGFSDSFTNKGNSMATSVSAVSGAGGMSSFAHNSFATLKTKAAGGTPTQLTDFGTHSGTSGTLLAAPLGAVDPTEAAMGANFGVWPNGNMIPLNAGIDSNQLVGVANALKVVGTGGDTLYNTMYTVDVGSAPASAASGQQIKTTRIVPQLFGPNDNMYGTFALTPGHNDGFLYLWAVQTEGGLGASHLKVARVPAADLRDKSKYTYWDGKTWSATQPAKTDASAAVYKSDAKIDTGEVFWSDRLGGWAIVTSTFGEFRMAVTGADLTTGWSAPTTIYKADTPPDHASDPVKVIYAGHSYPDWDPSGKSLLLSWTLDENWTQMAVVDFE